MGQFWTRIFKHKDVRILLLGLDSAGKTTILYKLKLDELVTTIPTIGFNVETIQFKDFNFTAWDIGSRDKIRPLFRHYYKGSDAVVFVIDSHDRERLDELNYDVIKPAVAAEELKESIFLFLANKNDLENNMTTEEIVDKLGLKNLKHKWNIISVSGVKGDGLHSALDWLASSLGSLPVKNPKQGPNPSKTQSKPSDNSVTMATGETSQCNEEVTGQKDYCSRAYSALKCLFVRTNRTSDSDDND
ncbi:hypothetical protein LOTGIDRAFT_164018 [Lottia gigantea]|uniref:Uncharacterized protein n=1 Tax=Lottia gigantea TaxID=225164 RepID=V4A616_LOTGI|nr:hypothetical protein LOTGIDRAFT_164018 [Lottia gigantea]ESO90435.1 hypothetical protein LOTGIDRAFT_164018 [Lottia gigantea]